ncbi:MAG: hypothetical protein OQJ98_00505 [Candidatus Pacebacteria bacterium]|nr:hypothetical protein [Candidatus Paceibacterota bacterium]
MYIQIGPRISPVAPIRHLGLSVKYASILLLQWVTWFIPAIANVFDEETGEYYQDGAAMILIAWFGSMLVMPCGLYLANGLSLSWTMLVGGVMHLTFGILYFLHERSWRM